MKWLKTFVGGILAGISIAIGGTVFLSLDNKVLGASDSICIPGRCVMFSKTAGSTPWGCP